MTHADLTRALREARVIVCAGTGGVGKTTISAAIGVEAARAGRRALVLTIDPARRLADALGLDSLDSAPMPVDLSQVCPEPAANGKLGSLDAMMLDPKPTFDALVTRFARDDATRDRILDNRIYRHLSEALAGSAEYAAMVQVHELVEAADYDLILVDTPPAQHALDFLRAPKRMREFLESRFVRTLVSPAVTAGRFGARLFGRGLERILGLIERVAGVGFLEDISEFLTAVDGLSMGFEERSKQVEDVLLGPETSFVLVCSGQAHANASSIEFLAQLDAFQVPLVAVVANRLRPWPVAQLPRSEDFALSLENVAQDARRISEALGETGAGETIVGRLGEYAEVCATQRRVLSELESLAENRGIACIRVEELSADVDHLEGLVEIGSMVAGGRPAVSAEQSA